MAYRDMPSAGTKLEMKIAAAFVEVPGCTDLSWEGYSRGVRNPTYLTSAGIIKKPAMTNFGQFKCKVFYDPNDDTHKAIRDRIALSAAAQGAALDDFKVTWADGNTTPATSTFTGFVSEFSPSATDVETGTVTADMTIEISTAVVHTDGSSS